MLTAVFVLAQLVSVMLPGAPGAKRAHAAAPAAGHYFGLPTSQIVFDQTLAANASVSVKLRGIAGTGIPDSADVSAIAGNLVVFTPTVNGNVSVYPAGAAKPAIGQVYYYADDNISNFIIAELAADGRATITNNSSASVRIGFNAQGYYTKAATGTAADNGATYAPLPGGRVVSTAEGVGVPNTDPLGPNETLTFDLSGKVGLPDEGLGPVVLSVTARQPTAGGVWYQVFTAGGTRPAWAHGSTDPNMGQRTTTVVVQPDAEGKVSIYNQSGSASIHFLVDVQGWYVPSVGTAPGGSFTPLPVKRILDTAGGVGVPAPGPVTGEQIVDLQVTGAGGVPSTGVHAVALNLWITGAETNGYLRVFPTGGTQTLTVIVGYQRLRVAGNLVSTHLSADGKLSIRNISTGQVNLYADVYGYWKAPTKPQPPTGLKANVGDGEAFVSWTPPTDDGGATVKEYTVTASPGGATETANGKAAGASFTGLANGTQYTFTATATNAIGTSGASAPSAAVTPQAAKTVSAPTITDVYSRDGAVRVSWAHPPSGPDGIESYEIKASPGGATATVAGDVTEEIVTGLTNGTAYTFTVTPINANGRGATSSPSREVVPRPGEAPLAPGGLLATPLNGRVDVQWVPAVDSGSDITGYTVTAEPGGRSIDMPADTTATSFTGLTNGTAYTITVTADNAAGTSEPSTAEDITPTASRAPSPPQSITAAPPTDGTVRLNWKAPVDTGTHPLNGYVVTASPGGQMRTVDTTSLDFDGLDPAQDYSFTITANSDAGASAASEPTQPVRPRLVTKQAPIVLSDASLAQLREARTGSDGVLVFAAPLTAQLNAIKTNDLVALGVTNFTEEGYLGRVTEVVNASGTLYLRTTPADLSEAFTQADRSISADASDTDSATTTLEPGVEIARPLVDGKSVRPGMVQARELDKQLKILPNGVTLHISKEMAPSGKYDLGSLASLKIPYVRLSADATFTGSMRTGKDKDSNGDGHPFFAFDLGHTGQFKVEGGIALNALPDFEKVLIKVNAFKKVILVGEVPVVEIGNWVLRLKIAAEGSLKMTSGITTSGKIAATCTAKTFTCVNRSQGLSADPFGISEPAASLNGSLTVSLPLDFEVLTYGIVGPAVILRPWLSVTADTAADPWFAVKWGVTAGLSANNFTAEEWLRKDDMIELYSDTIFQTGAFTGITIDPPSALAKPGESKAFTATPSANLPPDLDVSFRLTDGSELGTITSSSGIFTAGDTHGFVTVEAYSPDNQYVATAGVVIWNGGAPGAPANVTAKPTAGGIALSWDPPSGIGQAITRYDVTVAYWNGGNSTVHPFEGAVDHVRVEGLQTGIPYYVTVAAANPAGNSPGVAPTKNGGVLDLPKPLVIGAEFPEGDYAERDIARNISGAKDDTATAGTGGAALGGQYVYFFTQARSNVAPLEVRVPENENIYLVRRDRFTGKVTVASRGRDGFTAVPVATGTGIARAVTTSADGSTVAFRDLNGDVLIHDVDEYETWTAGDMPGLPAFNADGSVITYISGGTAWRQPGRNRAPVSLDDCGTACDFPNGVDISDDGDKVLLSAASSQNLQGLFLYNAANSTMTDLLPNRSSDVIEVATSGKISGDGTTITCYYEHFGGDGGLAVKSLSDGTRLGLNHVKVPLPDNAFRDQPVPSDISQAGDIVAYAQPQDGTEEKRIHLYGAPLGGTLTGAYIDRTSAPISVDLNRAGTSIVFTLFDEDLDKPFPGVWS